jgi:hypothetical protein
MDGAEFLGLQLPVMLAFVALLAGLAMLARQFHKLRQPAIVRRGAHPPVPHKRGPSQSD